MDEKVKRWQCVAFGLVVMLVVLVLAPLLHGGGNALIFDDQKTFKFYAQEYSYSESVTHRLIGVGYCDINWGTRHNLTGPADMYLFPNGPSTAFPTPADNITDFPSWLIHNCG